VPERFQERGLRDVVGVVRVAEQSQRGVEDRLLVAHHKLLARSPVALPTATDQDPVIVLVHKYRSARQKLVG